MGNSAEKIYDIGIIGGGTAGMTAAIYGQRAGKQTVIIEGSTFGGQITSSPNVENYPGIASVSGSEFSMNLLDQATKLGAETVMEQVTGIIDEGKRDQGHPDDRKRIPLQKRDPCHRRDPPPSGRAQ